MRNSTMLGVVLGAILTTCTLLGAEPPQMSSYEKALIFQLEEDEIVVRADSLAGPWEPVLEPIYTRFGQRCMAVPISMNDEWCRPTEFYQLAKGIQLRDDFSDPSKEWVSCFPDPRKYTIEYVDGTMKVSLAGSGEYSRAVLAPFPFLGTQDPLPMLGDFAMSIDILNVIQVNANSIGLIARSHPQLGDCSPEGLDVPVYMGLVGPDYNGGASIYSNPPNKSLVEQELSCDPNKAYRLIFTGVGQQLTLRLLDLEDLSDVMPPLTVRDWRHTAGAPGLWINAGTGSCDVTLDNWLVVGTTPSVGAIDGF